MNWPWEPLDSGNVFRRAAEAALRGVSWSVVQEYPPLAAGLLRWMRRWPTQWRVIAVRWGVRGKGVPLGRFLELPFGQLADALLPRVSGRHAILGAPHGGLATLAAATGRPYLVTHVLFSVRHAKRKEDAEAVRRLAQQLADRLETRLPSCWEIVVHYDPVHDALFTDRLTHVRLRLRRLPDSWVAYLRQCETVDFWDCAYTWPMEQVGERTFIQYGGLGALPASAFPGASRARLLRRESEWGTPNGLLSDAQTALAGRVRVRREAHPASLSAWIADWLAGESLYCSCFTLVHPLLEARLGLPVYWLPFGTRDAWKHLKTYLERRPVERLFVTLLPSFPRTPDWTPLEDWQKLAPEVHLLGGHPASYPEDAYLPFAWERDLQRLPRSGQAWEEKAPWENISA